MFVDPMGANAISRNTVQVIENEEKKIGLFFERDLYLTEEIEEILPLNTVGEEKYYTIEIKINKIVPDINNDATMRTALGQSTSYAIMDYFDQFQYGQSTAMMASEISYTGLLTVTSTALSTPMIVLGSYLAQGVSEGLSTISSQAGSSIMRSIQQGLANAFSSGGKAIALNILGKTLDRSISQVFEEIYIDSIIEGTASNFVTKVLGLSEDAGHWLSVFATTARETKGFSTLLSNKGAKVNANFNAQAQAYQASKVSTEFESWYAENSLGMEGDDLGMFGSSEQQIVSKIQELGLYGEAETINKKAIFASGLATIVGALLPFTGFIVGNIGMSQFIEGLSGALFHKMNTRLQDGRHTKSPQQLLDENFAYMITKPNVNPQHDLLNFATDKTLNIRTHPQSAPRLSNSIPN
jgi:hypothetical protein